MKKLITALLLVALTLPAFALRQYAVVVQGAIVEPTFGKAFLVRNKVRTSVTKPSAIQPGDVIYIPDESQIMLTFPDGSQETVDGEANVEITPLINNQWSIDIPMQFIKDFFSHLFSHFSGKH